jgi:phosphocarrier protein FPr
MIGLVVVSHSAKVAEGVCDLAGQVAAGKVRLAAAGGTSDPNYPIGTDACRVAEAIEAVFSTDGVLVFMDMGSAVLSAGLALDFLDESRRPYVRLCAAPLVEGAVAAATLAAAGAGIEEIVREAEGALTAKMAPAPAAGEETLATLVNPLGLHARPAARLVRLARQFEARLTLRNASAVGGPADAGSINALLGLAARCGDTLAIGAEGPQARAAVAAVAAFIEGGCGDQTGEAPFSGTGASAGIGIGPLTKVRRAEALVAAREAADPDGELDRLRAAIQAAHEATAALRESSEIFDAQLLLLEDAELLDAATGGIRGRRLTAEAAWEAAAEERAARLDSLADPYLRARAADVRDVAARVMRTLTGAAPPMAPLEQPSVVAAYDLTPSEVQQLDRALVIGLCLEAGSASAHSAILARALGIPTVVGVGPGILDLPEGTLVAVDGERGTVLVSPGEEQLRKLEARRLAGIESRRAAADARSRPAATRDGHRVRVVANISGIEEAAQAVGLGAEGVGVLRSEFLFLDRDAPPPEEEQVLAYGAIARALEGRPLVVRTLDIGGDKAVSYIPVGRENNPFLGWRGIRLLLDRRDLLATQLRAILRAGAERPIDILLPMVSSLDELRRVKEILGEAAADLERQGMAFARAARLGVMIEVPAAVTIADRLAREAAFFSIGSNDLVQYVMVADRTNPRVASIADPLQPAVLRMIRQTVEAGREAGIEVGLCGELGADPLAAPLLIGLGVEELSVSALLIPELKRTLAQWTLEEAREIARQSLALDSAGAVRQFLLKEART